MCILTEWQGALFLLSKWYKRSELGLRTVILACGYLLSNVFGSLIASGILDGMEGVWGYAAWRWYVDLLLSNQEHVIRLGQAILHRGRSDDLCRPHRCVRSPRLPFHLPPLAVSDRGQIGRETDGRGRWSW